jgi:hypothetical protein
MVDAMDAPTLHGERRLVKLDVQLQPADLFVPGVVLAGLA